MASDLKVIAGATWGSGTLHYQGKSYPLKVKAATAGGVGFRKTKGKGEVYGLEKLGDFPGFYGGGGAGLTVVNKSPGLGTVLENNRGVILALDVTDGKGLQLSLSAGGVDIDFADK